MFSRNYIYKMFTETGKFVMASKKFRSKGSSRFAITTGQSFNSKSNPLYLGTLHSNFVGSMYRLMSSSDSQDTPQSKELLAVGYVNTIFKNRDKTNEPRRLALAIPSVINRADYTCDKLALLKSVKEGEPCVLGVEVLHNKQPQLGSKGFTLPFSERVKEASVKNFLIVQNDNVICEFGKSGNDEYILDFVSPFTPLTAFALALSSLDFKLCCE